MGPVRWGCQMRIEMGFQKGLHRCHCFQIRPVQVNVVERPMECTWGASSPNVNVKGRFVFCDVSGFEGPKPKLQSVVGVWLFVSFT